MDKQGNTSMEEKNQNYGTKKKKKKIKKKKIHEKNTKMYIQ